MILVITVCIQRTESCWNKITATCYYRFLLFFLFSCFSFSLFIPIPIITVLETYELHPSRDATTTNMHYVLAVFQS